MYIRGAGKCEKSERVERLYEGARRSGEDKEPDQAARSVVSYRPSGYFDFLTLKLQYIFTAGGSVVVRPHQPGSGLGKRNRSKA